MKTFRKSVAAFLVVIMLLMSVPFAGISVLAAEPPVLATITDPTWKEKSSATAQWTAVEGANYYDVSLYVYDEDEKTCLGETLTGTDITEIDVQQEINQIYNSANASSSYVYIQFSVVSKYVVNGNVILESTRSERSALIKYIIKNTYQFEVPENVTLSEDLIATWDCPDKWEKITGFNVRYSMHLKGQSDSYNQLCCVGKSSVSSDGKAQVDLSDDLMERYIERGYTNEEVEISIAVNMYVLSSDIEDDITYINSEFSLPSNTITYIPRKTVESIRISPNMPIVSLDNSYFLGKTVYPEDAYYSSVEWTSSNSDVVSVDSNGKITGVSVGTAEITATIGNTSQNVTVAVYEIESNIENENNKDEVADAAGGIIDDIANSDNPDLSDTDIEKDDLEDIKQDIQAGIENGNSFHTDIKAIQTYFDAYKTNWGQIQKAANELNAQFAGAYNIEVEMYHKDKDGDKHHIGNIVELDNLVTFTFDLPTGMKEIESGETKKFVLVRIHKNTIEPIDYIINDDGTFTAQSDKYSDFVWLVIEEDTCLNNKHSIKNHEGKTATCLNPGYAAYETCLRCDYTTYEEIPATGHNYSDGVCTECGEKKDVDCSCNCHKGGFSGFIWKILRFFYKLFGMNKTCGCGVAHY